MVFKKSFDTEKEASQQAWTDLPTSIKPDDDWDIDIVHTQSIADVLSTPEDWIDRPKKAVFYIRQNNNTTCYIWVQKDTTTNKWHTEIGLNPMAYGYNEAKVNLLHRGWQQHNIPFDEFVLTDKDLENAVLHQVYAFEKKGEHLKTQDISEALGARLSKTKNGSADYPIGRYILQKLQKQGLVCSFGIDAWSVTDKGKAKIL